MDFISRTSCYPNWLKYTAILFFIIIRSTAIEVRCGKPGRAPVGRFRPESDNYTMGSTVTYFCEYPLLIAKPHVRICQADGTWSGAIPLCYDRTVVRDVLQSSTLQDKTAAKALDNNPDTCFSTGWEKDGYWSAYLPDPSTVTAVKIKFPTSEQINIEVTVKSEPRDVTICPTYENYNGDLSSKIFYCPENTGGTMVNIRDLSIHYHYFEICEVEIFVRPKNTCLVPDVPDNGFGVVAVSPGSSNEREYTYFCNRGYDLFGENKSACQPSGTWTSKAPVCYRIQCVVNSNFDNGSVSFSEDIEGGVIPFEGQAQYSCNPGFVLQGTSVRFCVGWNRWSQREPSCVEKRCNPRTDGVANGKLVANSTTVHSTALLVCNDGYQPLTDYQTECLPTGQWSYASLICAPIRCNPNPTVPHGSFRLLANSTFYGSRLQVTCDQGYAVRDNGLRMCERDGKWEDLSDVCAEITCDSVPEEIPERGIWQLFNDSFRSSGRTILILKCHPGYHIVGTPIVRCLENGSWSHSVATCMKTPQPVMSTPGEWNLNSMLVAAIAAGVVTAVCILCLVGGFFVMRKRRHSRTTTTVFHVGMANRPTFSSIHKGIIMSPEEHYYTSAMYEDIPETRGYDVSKPRKPSVGLPLLPLDSDPVYAQPFETGSSTSVAELKLRNGSLQSKEDPYSGHIYAEPIDSRRPPSGSSTVSGCVAEAWFRGGNTVRMTRKMSLPNCQQIPNASCSSFVPKAKEVRRTSSTALLCLEDTEKRDSQQSARQELSASFGSLGLLDEVQNNSIYLRPDDDCLQTRSVSSGFKMTDNDIYRDEYFSSA